MNLLLISLLTLGTTFVQASLQGPFLLWGLTQLEALQQPALSPLESGQLETLYQSSKAIVVFLRNHSSLSLSRSTELQQHFAQHQWLYLPQRALPSEPNDFSSNVEFIFLSADPQEEAEQIIEAYQNSLNLYDAEGVLGILAHQQPFVNSKSKRHSKTVHAPEPFLSYIAQGNTAALVSAKPPVLHIGNGEDFLELKQFDSQSIAFESQEFERSGQLHIDFLVDQDKIHLALNFTISTGSWILKGCSVDFNDYHSYMPIVGNDYSIPSAPLGFSYRCGSHTMVFANENDTVKITNYQLQPWLKGSTKFGSVFDCVGFFTTPIIAGLLVTLFFGLIVSIGIMALMDIKTPTRFDPKAKPLTFVVDE